MQGSWCWTARDKLVRECGLRKRVGSRSRVLVVRPSLRERPYFLRASQNEKREWNEIGRTIRGEKGADASGEAEDTPLLVPIKRQPRVVHQLSCREFPSSASAPNAA